MEARLKCLRVRAKFAACFLTRLDSDRHPRTMPGPGRPRSNR
jgi:hypothetical protein